jgi:hypothetical protein
MQLHKRAFGLAIGILSGLCFLLSTWWLLIIEAEGKTLSTISKFFYGYSFSWGGAFLGLIWGFVYGFIAGFLIAWLYNIFDKMIYKSTH